MAYFGQVQVLNVVTNCTCGTELISPHKYFFCCMALKVSRNCRLFGKLAKNIAKGNPGSQAGCK